MCTDFRTLCRETTYFPFGHELLDGALHEKAIGEGIWLIEGEGIARLSQEMQGRLVERVRWCREALGVPTMKISVAPFQIQKFWPEPGATITPLHINSAFTFVRSDCPVVVIYREDELLKVLVHELLHHLPIGAAVDHLNRELRGALDLGVSILIEEALVEYFAVLVHGILLAREKKLGGCTLSEYLRGEQEWSRKNCQKLVALYHTGSKEIHTHAFSYLILKTVFLDLCTPVLDADVLLQETLRVVSRAHQDRTKRAALPNNRLTFTKRSG